METAKAGKIYLETSKYAKAIKHFEEVERTYPHNADVECCLGMSLRKNGQEEVAISHFKKAINLGYNKAVTFYDHAVELDRQEAYDSAILFYEYALSIEPNDPYTLSNLGADYAEVGKLTEAIEYARKACIVAPHDLINLNTLAAIHVKMGEFAKGKELLVRIVEIAEEGIFSFSAASRACYSTNRLAFKCLLTGGIWGKRGLGVPGTPH